MPAIEIGRQSRGSIRDNVDLMSKKSKKIGDVIRIADLDEQTPDEIVECLRRPRRARQGRPRREQAGGE